MKKQTTKTFLAVLLGAGMSQGILQAQNPFYEPGDLILFLQKPGSTDSIFVSLGSAANLYRGAAAGPTADRQEIDIININDELTTAFGANWASDTGVYAGLIGARSASTGTNVFDGDQTRTLYASRSRAGVGTPGSASSATWDFTTSGAETTGASNAVAFGNIFETNYTTQAAVALVSVSKVDVFNPFVNVSLGIQDTAFKAFPGGVQQRGSASTYGAFGLVASPEFMLDLYRIVPRNDDETVGEVSGVKRIGSYEGTVTIDSAGSVSFITQGIPEIPAFVDSDGDGLSDFLEDLLVEYGFDKNVSQPELVAQFLANEGLFTADSIQDLSVDDLIVQKVGNDVTVTIPVESSVNLVPPFTPEGNATLTIPNVPADKEFYRIRLAPDAP